MTPTETPAGELHRILFVDDEPSVLDGLRNVLRKERKRWKMVFALGAEAALAEIEAAHFDVVVSDMRMPGMDGAALLQAIRERDPSVTRIILSGHAERDLLIRALPVAHQFLSKPCDADVLRAVVQRACGLHALLGDDGIRRAIGRLERLPSPPRTYLRLTQLLSAPGVDIRDIAAVVEQDVAMSAKVLQLVNSAYFGLPRRMTSVADALRYLGLDLVRSLTLSVHALGEMRAVAGLSMERLQEDAIVAARLARRFCSDRAAGDDAFTAALVHDIGRIALGVGLPEAAAAIAAEAASTGQPIQEVERVHLGVSHAEVGAYLLGSWGLPMAVVEAVAYHHDPGLVGETSAGVVAQVHVATALAHGTAPDVAFLERAGVLPSLARWTAEADEERRQRARAVASENP
jgi:HD-like signal output (HDOD) protein/CheY-like chemotaxis protein